MTSALLRIWTMQMLSDAVDALDGRTLAHVDDLRACEQYCIGVIQPEVPDDAAPEDLLEWATWDGYAFAPALRGAALMITRGSLHHAFDDALKSATGCAEPLMPLAGAESCVITHHKSGLRMRGVRVYDPRVNDQVVRFDIFVTLPVDTSTGQA